LSNWVKQVTPAIMHFAATLNSELNAPGYAPTLVGFEFCRELVTTAALRIVEQS
jgi:hypothetical protein